MPVQTWSKRTYSKPSLSLTGWTIALLCVFITGVFLVSSPAQAAKRAPTNAKPASQTAHFAPTSNSPSGSTAAATPNYSLSPQDGWELSRMEMTLFGAHYPQEAVFSRLKRVEETLYGEAQESASPQDRMSRLKAFFQNKKPNTTANDTASSSGANAAYGSPEAQTKPETVKKSTKAPATNRKRAAIAQPTLEVPKEVQAAKKAAAAAAAAAAPKADEHYPRVDEIEQKVFGEVYNNVPLAQRLDRLEVRVYGRPIQGGDLMARVDALSQTVIGNNSLGPTPSGQPSTANTANGNGNPYNPYQPNPAQNGVQYPNVGGAPLPYPGGAPPLQTYTPPPGYGNPTPGYNPTNPIINPEYEAANNPYVSTVSNTSPDFLNSLNQVEKKVLKTTYPSEPNASRLSRLENNLFHSTAPPGVSDDDRLQRILAVQAGGGGTGVPSDRAGGIKTLIPIILMIVPLLL